MSTKPTKRLVVFCDGTWCGRETGTNSNINILAKTLGTIEYNGNDPVEEPTKVFSITTNNANVTAGYQEGVGLNKTFLEYLWDGATASTIGEECISVYKYIVDHYTDEYEIYMFGFSRGAFTLRCVAGMINNCGIIKKADHSSDDLKLLCDEIYRSYRSPLKVDKPKSTKWIDFRRNNDSVWKEPRPVRVMIIADTVGSLGIPRLNAGVGFDWPEFYSQKVSSVIKEMYHAPSLHDRLWIFQPCLAFPGPGVEKCIIHQKWFPGCHYDVGRQIFRFFRSRPRNLLERIVSFIPRLLSRTIYPNEVLADVNLRWMLECLAEVHKNDKSDPIIPNLEQKINEISQRIASPQSTQPTGATGSGDVYNNVLDYGPGGRLWSLVTRIGKSTVNLLNRFFPPLGDDIKELLGIKVVLNILTATRDRRIPGEVAEYYHYENEETVITANQEVKAFTVLEQAKIKQETSKGVKRYPSRTVEAFELWKGVFGVPEMGDEARGLNGTSSSTVIEGLNGTASSTVIEGSNGEVRNRNKGS
ncbi:hypothetical protein B0J11DRAFT_505881 [Dendryphion nanum]|uniref:T6SS Phospholipase effector Tle1-like catalytic domain-containing protein n=1 Tax=Dendryphion nanum TaxID=256645 RepID=A0A9P9INK2_9PLEO|nr:hypothetical protein B0J11DRAFT_505881 [Dendryphion nanum]